MLFLLFPYAATHSPTHTHTHTQQPQAPLLGQLINCLLARLADEDETVKLVSLRGLGNVATVGKLEVDR